MDRATDEYNASIEATALPTDREFDRRRNLVVQAWRFVVLNLKILRLSRQKH
ncbi:MAG: hypothetical protein R2770_03390 [Acidimicrobiales bacterium]